MDTREEFRLWHALYHLEARYWHEVDCHGGRRANAQNYPAGNCQISKSGGLFAQGSNPVSRDTPIWKLVSLIMWTGGL